MKQYMRRSPELRQVNVAFASTTFTHALLKNISENQYFLFMTSLLILLTKCTHKIDMISAL